MKATAEFCPECGATLDPSSDGSDTEVYNELAKANLLRNRHQLQEAINVALGILRKYPNNATAHTLLGDIYAELDDLKQSAEWYEMALDLNPDSASDQLKLQKVRERMANQQSASTAKALGIPQSGTQVYVYIAVAVALLLLCSIGAFMLGKSGGTPKPTGTDGPFIIKPGEPPAGGTPPSGGPPQAKGVAADDNSLTLLQGKTSLGADFLGAIEDPRSSALWVTVRSDGTDTADMTAVKAAEEAFSCLPNYKHLTVRVVKSRVIEFVGETEYTKFTEALRRNPSATATEVITMAFTDPWRASAPTTQTGGGSLGGSTYPGTDGNATGGGTNTGQTDPTNPGSNPGGQGVEPKTEANPPATGSTTPPPAIPTDGTAKGG